MTLKEWSEKYNGGRLPTHPATERGAVSVIFDSYDTSHAGSWELFHLDDYRVSSVCGIVIWLLPTEKS